MKLREFLNNKGELLCGVRLDKDANLLWIRLPDGTEWDVYVSDLAVSEWDEVLDTEAEGTV